jgi:glycosyltransferase involved in cell wall biosynthesis
MSQVSLEFLIPTYKRFGGALVAANSITSQVLEHKTVDKVSVRVVDDGSPGFSVSSFRQGLLCSGGYVTVEANSKNKGMSQNIFDMVVSSRSKFCTILTDDDWLMPGKLLNILAHLDQIADDPTIGGIFTPRFSYLEDGSLHGISCKFSEQDQLLSPGPLNSLRYSRNGFILTGFIFRPGIAAVNDWSLNIHNGYFPIINFGIILSRYSLLYVNQNWFHHAVLNHCHWESWGKDKKAQTKRLYRDYMSTVSYLAGKSFACIGLGWSLSSVFRDEIALYSSMIKYRKLGFWDKMFAVSPATIFRPAYWASLGCLCCQVLCSFVLAHFIHPFRNLKRLVVHKFK